MRGSSLGVGEDIVAAEGLLERMDRVLKDEEGIVGE